MATATDTQTRRPLSVQAPAGAGALPLRLVSFKGQEGISQLFLFQLTMTAPSGTDIPFDKLLGQKVAVTLESPAAKPRYFNGICSRMSQGGSEAGGRTTYRMDVVPQLWLLTRRAQTRNIFQQMSVPEILKKVLTGLDVEYKIQGTFKPRDYCVQYRETDFNFVSRLMEEEGIYYYFTHTADGHKMILGNAPEHHYEIPAPSTVIYDSVRGGHKEARVSDWEKAQELRSGKYTLWDHCFELSNPIVKSQPRTAPATVTAGGVTHKLLVGGNDRLEIYEYPGEYTQRFDGVAPGGGERAQDLSAIQEDGDRTTRIRVEQETAPAVVIRGAGDCANFVAGHGFTLKTQDALARYAQADGKYVLTAVAHSAHYSGDERSGGSAFHYSNHFTCIPAAVPFRPARVTPKPTVQGSQTAVVVGPSDAEIFTDKYGRVKVQFHWDREGKSDAGSSCWIRVAQPWAGKRWGAHFWPRIGQEVVVDFLEGDPDQPIITGSVYNAEMMPPYALPENQTKSGVKSRSSLKGNPDNFNEIRFEDKKDHEQIYFHAEKDFDRVVENNDTLKVGFEKKDKGDQTIEVFNNQSLKVGCDKAADGSQTIEVFNNQSLKVGCDKAADGSQTIEIYKDRTETVKTGNEQVTIEQGNRTITVSQGNDIHQIKQGDRTVKIDMGKDALLISMGDQKTKVDLGKIETEAMQSIEIKVGQSSIKLEQSGVTIKGMQVKIEGQIQAEMKGAMATVKGDGMLTLKGGVTMIN